MASDVGFALDRAINENTKLRAEVERLRSALARIHAHWNEFGPENGFEELIETIAKQKL